MSPSDAGGRQPIQTHEGHWICPDCGVVLPCHAHPQYVNPDAGGRPARSALLGRIDEAITSLATLERMTRAGAPNSLANVVADNVLKDVEVLRDCRAALEAAGLTAGDRPSSLFHAEIDVLASVNGALHAVHAPWRIDVRDGQAIAVPTPEIYSPLAAGDRPSPDPQIDCPVCGQAIRQAASATLSLAYWQHFNWMHSQLAVGARPAPQEPEQEVLHAFHLLYTDFEDIARFGCSHAAANLMAVRVVQFKQLFERTFNARALPVSSPAPAMPLQHTDLFQVGVMLGYLARFMHEKKYARVNVPCEYRGDHSGGFDRFTVDDVELASAELIERYTRGASK